jgi:RNA polymerase sigma-70 factor (ECF subfamily)
MAISLEMRETIRAGIERARTGTDVLPAMDEETFRAFYERTARGLRTYLARITGDSHLADDLLQEAYYRFYRAGAAHESEAHRRNSLFCIATNAARDAMRRRGNGVDVPLESGEGHDHAVDARSADRTEGRLDLRAALAKLEPRQREMLWLAYGHGSSHVEIAEIVGVKSGSVKLMLFRARRKLAALLRPGGRR